MKASIIIRTYNEEEKIGKCLEAIFNQQVKFPFEIIIVDSESNDKTLEITSKFPVKIINIKKKDFSYGRALNIGCSASKGKYLVILSGHSVPFNKNWLCNLLKNFNNKKIAGVYGKQVPFTDCGPLEKRMLAESWPTERQVQTDNPFFSNANAAIRKNVWSQIKFNEKLTAVEDQEWVKRTQKLGYVVVYEPNAVVTHSHNESIIRNYVRRYREMHALFFIHGINPLFSKYKTERIHTIKRDVVYIRENNYNPLWILKSTFLNGMLYLAAFVVFLEIKTS